MATQIAQQQDKIHEKIGSFLSFLKEDVEVSRDLLEAGAYTKLSKTIEGFFLNPLESLIDTYKSVDQKIKSIIDTIAKTFFNRNKEIIEKVFEVPGQSNLHYYIILKEDTTENRSIFFNFINSYEELGIENKLPIVIQFIPKRVMDKVTLESEIALN